MADVAPPLEASILVIFGISGDLARRKVLPALYNLYKTGLLNEQTYIIGTSRKDLTNDAVLDDLKTAITENTGTCDQQVLDMMHAQLTMLKLDPAEVEGLKLLSDKLDALESTTNTCLQRLFYLSIPPQVFTTVVQQMGACGLNKGCQHGGVSRLLVEKPFGYDLASAQELISTTAQHFTEDQVYRIDHYLAKETAQNILTFRRLNPLFNQVWDGQHITGMSITAAEKIGIEGRSNFYDHVGALRDLIQSHLMQLLSLTVMDIPDELDSASIHAAKQQVLASLMPVPSEQVNDRSVRGQYDTYRTEVGNPESNTETYASVVLFSEGLRWGNVPLRLTTGKALKIKRTSITVDFGEHSANRLQFRIQPDEGITLTLQVKQPGLSTQVEQTTMDFSYKAAFGQPAELDAYERVLIEAARGDRTLFATDKEVLRSWELLEPVITAWKNNEVELVKYASGSDGPDTEKLTMRP